MMRSPRNQDWTGGRRGGRWEGRALYSRGWGCLVPGRADTWHSGDGKNRCFYPYSGEALPVHFMLLEEKYLGLSRVLQP